MSDTRDSLGPRSDRRGFLRWLAGLAAAGSLTGPDRAARATTAAPDRSDSAGTTTGIELFLCGDVMSGRAIDQVLPFRGDPRLYEPYLRDARDYVRLAETVYGAIDAPVDFAYPWGDALDVLAERRPAVRLINLETAVTARGTPWPDKGIHYRMHPANLPMLRAAAVDCCCLANNHVLDWGYPGLQETLETLRRAGIATVGAGQDDAQACAPAILDLPDAGRLLVVGLADRSSGTPDAWSAQRGRPGVCLLPDLSTQRAADVARRLRDIRRPGDLLVVSIHWGGNWDYRIPRPQRQFAHRLIDQAGVDLIHGHSSHHVKGIEVYQGRLILYGCGDFINDYEGIGGHEAFRGDLSLMYFPTLDPASGRLLGLQLIPTQVRRFRVRRAGATDRQWLHERLNREGGPLGTGVASTDDGGLRLIWT